MKNSIWKILIFPFLILAFACSNEATRVPVDPGGITQNNPTDSSGEEPPSNNLPPNTNNPPANGPTLTPVFTPGMIEAHPINIDAYVELVLTHWSASKLPELDLGEKRDSELKIIYQLDGHLIFAKDGKTNPCCGGRILRLADFTNSTYVDLLLEKESEGGDEGFFEVDFPTTLKARLAFYLTTPDYDPAEVDTLKHCRVTKCASPDWKKLDSPLDEFTGESKGDLTLKAAPDDVLEVVDEDLSIPF